MQIIDRPSPNFDERPTNEPVDMLILHYTGMPTAEEAFARMCDPVAKVSAHYAIDRDGTVLCLVDEAKRAWHAGVAYWAGADDINARSIGVELVNPGHDGGYPDFTEAQMATLIPLCREILSRHPIPSHRVLAHSDVAFRRKNDPGERFDWARLAGQGIGLWPQVAQETAGQAEAPMGPGEGGSAVGRLQRALGRFGYGLEVSGRYDHDTEQCMRAFQRHWRPALVNGVADRQCIAILEELLNTVSGLTPQTGTQGDHGV